MSLGLYVDEVYTNFRQGSLAQTSDPFNLALEGRGFLLFKAKMELKDIPEMVLLY